MAFSFESLRLISWRISLYWNFDIFVWILLEIRFCFQTSSQWLISSSFFSILKKRILITIWKSKLNFLANFFLLKCRHFLWILLEIQFGFQTSSPWFISWIVCFFSYFQHKWSSEHINEDSSRKLSRVWNSTSQPRPCWCCEKFTTSHRSVNQHVINFAKMSIIFGGGGVTIAERFLNKVSDFFCFFVCFFLVQLVTKNKIK